jgi:hypothetical protein
MFNYHTSCPVTDCPDCLSSLFPITPFIKRNGWNDHLLFLWKTAVEGDWFTLTMVAVVAIAGVLLLVIWWVTR